MCTVVLVAGSIGLVGGWLLGVWSGPHLDRFVVWLEEREERNRGDR